MSEGNDVVKGKWNEFKGELQKLWGKVTNDEWEQTKGDMQSIQGLLQQKYGESTEQLKSKLDNIYAGLSSQKDKLTDSIKDSLKSDRAEETNP